jgi:uncharacterized protein (DUF2344 family)
MGESTVEILNKGMQCLLDKLGVVETEYFISVISREQFDYTKWQQEYFDRLSPEEIDREAKQYLETHPFEGKAKIIL